LLSAAGAECTTANEDIKTAKTLESRDLKREYELARTVERCIQRAVGQARNIAGSVDASNYVAVNALLEPYVVKAGQDVQEAKANLDFTELSWGLGFGASYSFEDAIEKASIVNGVVRVEEDQTLHTRVLLEFHRFFWTGETDKKLRWGTGPFLALAAGTGDTVLGVGLGWMWGLKSADPADSEGFSVGIGVMLDDDVKTLGDGFEENQPPPPSETTVRFEEKSRPAAILFVTRTF